MKTKKQIYLFGAVFLFLSVFFVRLDGVNHVAKADCVNGYDENGNDCTDTSSADTSSGSCDANCLTCTNGQCTECGENEVPSGTGCGCADGFTENSNGDCVASTGSAGGSCDANCLTCTNGQCTECGENEVPSGTGCGCADGFTENSNGDCVASTGSAGGSTCDACFADKSQSDCSAACPNGYTQAECASEGLSVNKDGSECCTSIDVSCMNGGSSAVTSGGGTTGAACSTDSDCASGLVCNTIGSTCGQSVFGAVKNTVTGFASSIKLNGVQVGMKNGNLTVGAKVSIGGTTVPAGSYASNGSVYSPNGALISGVTAASFANMLGVNANGQPINSAGAANPNGSFPGTGAAAAGTVCSGQVIGGVCFPGNTGLSTATISQILLSILNWILEIFTTLAILAFVISGIQYLISAGDEGMIETAKRNAKWSIVGILVGLSGFVILQAVAALISGTSQLF